MDALLVVLVSQLVTVHGFKAGAICQSIDTTTYASDFLRGRHLRVYETPWTPFATVDPSANGRVGGHAFICN